MHFDWKPYLAFPLSISLRPLSNPAFRTRTSGLGRIPRLILRRSDIAFDVIPKRSLPDLGWLRCYWPNFWTWLGAPNLHWTIVHTWSTACNNGGEEFRAYCSRMGIDEGPDDPTMSNGLVLRLQGRAPTMDARERDPAIHTSRSSTMRPWLRFVEPLRIPLCPENSRMQSFSREKDQVLNLHGSIFHQRQQYNGTAKIS